MAEFVVAFLVFIGAHVLPTRTGLRDRLIGILGRRAYLILYSVLSLALLAWLIAAAARAPHIAFWPTTRMSVILALIVTAIAAVLLSCGATRPSPVSISLRGGTADPQHPGILALTRHPVLWALFLWSVAHCIANGDARRGRHVRKFRGVLRRQPAGARKARPLAPVRRRLRRSNLGEFRADR